MHELYYKNVILIMAFTKFELLNLTIAHYLFIELCADVYVLTNITAVSVIIDVIFIPLYFITRCCMMIPDIGCKNNHTKIKIIYSLLAIDTIAYTFACISNIINTPHFQETQYLYFCIIKLICKFGLVIACLYIICKEQYNDEEIIPLFNKRRPPGGV
jgi:hypothetical protein